MVFYIAEKISEQQYDYIKFNTLTNPVEVLVDENGWVKGLKCVKMGLSEKDESGRRRPYVLENTEHVIEVDTVIMSLGTSPNPIIAETTEGLEINKWKCIITVSTSITCSVFSKT